MAKKKTKAKDRDGNILMAYRGEIKMTTSSVPDKTKYNRKSKHRNNSKDYSVKFLFKILQNNLLISINRSKMRCLC